MRTRYVTRILSLIIKIHMYKQNEFLDIKHDRYVLEYTISNNRKAAIVECTKYLMKGIITV